MEKVYICDYIRTPIGRYGGALASIRADDLAALPIRELISRNSAVDWQKLDEVVLGCANQAGEDNRNVARMAVLLSGLPETVPGVTVNRLCASGMDATIMAARAIKCGEADLVIAGGIESMSRAPFVTPKAETAFARQNAIYDTTIGWRFINKRIQSAYGTESMPETAENVAKQFNVSRGDQDALAFSSQQRARQAIETGRFAREIVPVQIPKRKGDDVIVDTDEHPRLSPVEKLAALKTPFRENGTVTAGNASGINDGSCALLMASEQAVKEYGLNPLAEFVGAATAGVAPGIMGVGPVKATQKLCQNLGLSIEEFDLIELNEAFAAQAIAVCRELGLDPFSRHINPNGGAISLGHPLGMTGARLVGSAALEMSINGNTLALCSMCVGVGQGVSVALRSI